MDYCSSCRRHLNGALVCPGCGAYAPDIAPVAVSRYTTVQPRPTMAAASPAVADPAEVPESGPEPESESAAPDPDPYDGFEGATPAPQGRAARRRQRVRWKKNQRRAVVATAVALVGGGLTFTALDRLSADRAEAASAPDTAGLGSAEEDASRHTGPSSTRPDDQRSSATPSTRSPANGRSDRRAAAAPTSVTPQGSRPDAVPTPSTTSASASTSVSDPRSRNASSSSGSSGSSDSGSGSGDAAGAASPQPSTPAATGGSGGSVGSGGGSDSGTSPASPDPAATSPSQLCLLVVCIG
ncbi:hypothetical protein ACFFS2_40935 [Streptomyces aurantiacus]|uniref:Uncharacterized protein n=1 Tax=Streptomyces aurantiacus TaxID=47760 RepID=A0A7G1P151_9ACTN|nr:hypothetical protein [Streptomyces aurantiacus]BCL29493.1 hypothetical protein GCM10017557_43520 [Streptomyces aurantiacus]